MLKNQYPIGVNEPLDSFDQNDINQWIGDIEQLPDALTTLTSNLSQNERHATYRENSWDVQTLIHHLADAHLHGYIRTKLILTENQPTVSTFNEENWTKLPDNELPLEYSLYILDGIHKRWTALLKSLPESAFHKTMIHPDNGEQTLADLIAKMAWHGNHHFAQIQLALGKVK